MVIKQNMKIEDKQELQKSVMNSIFFMESSFYEFSALSKAIDTMIFGKYKKLADIAKSKRIFSELQLSNISTDIITGNLSELFKEIIVADFTIANIYRDVKILVNEAKQWHDLETIIELQETFKKLDEIRAWEFSKNYRIEELYDGAIWDLTIKSDRKKEGKTLGYETWLPLLDKYTEWIQKGTVTRLNAYSNVGKSKFSYQIVNKLLDQWAYVLYFSLEVQKNMVIYQLIANKYKKNIWDVYRMDFDDIDFGELFLKKLEVIDDKYTLLEILQYAELRKPDVIVIDFVQNIQAEWKSEYERMTNVAVSIQQLAIKNNIAVFDLSQISNAWTQYASWDAIPSKGSGALVASADVWLIMRRDKMDDSVITMNIAKNKFWFNGKSIDYRVDFAKGLFTEIGESKNNWF